MALSSTSKIISEANKVFSIPKNTESKPVYKDERVKTFIKGILGIAKETDITSCEVEDIESLKSMLISAFKVSSARDLKLLISKSGQNLKTTLNIFNKPKGFRNKSNSVELKKAFSIFIESLENVMNLIEDEEAKVNKTFYSLLKEKAPTASIPSRIYETIELHSCDVIIYAASSPKTTFKKIENGCYIIKANVIGVNTDTFSGTKGQFEKLKTLVMKKFGSTIHEDPIPRTTYNVKYFLLLDFGIKINNVTFIDNLRITESSSFSDDAIVLKYQNEKVIESNILKQKTLRIMFEEENITLINSIRSIQQKIEDLKYELNHTSKMFKIITSYIGDPYNGEGLPITEINRIDSYFDRWLSFEIDSEFDSNKRLNIIRGLHKTKIKAYTEFFHFNELKKEYDDLKSRLNQLESLKIQNQQAFLDRSGIISPKMERLFMKRYEE